MLDYNTYINKVKGCWMGKNIGGTLGAPLEGMNCEDFEKYYDYYLQDLDGKAFPNDDLDLQLVWLNAVEKYGKQLNSRILGEYWLSYIVPNFSEYGGGKSNLAAGIEPPLSGVVNNLHNESCGAFIRSEIWACIAPGHPEIATRYAIMDAEVDHSGEGIYGEIFCAALESAAFVESDREKLIEIAQSYIPDNCGVKRAVESVKKSYSKGLTWKQAFYELMREEPSNFSYGRKGWTDENGKKILQNKVGYDAPGNIGIFVIGWFYGEGDFDKSLSITLNCGEDTDCTVATMGAVYGILNGIDNIPEKWIKPISNAIVTCCINASDLTISIPKTIDELTYRIAFIMPTTIGREYFDMNLRTIAINNNMLYTGKKNKSSYFIDGELERSPFRMKYETELFDTVLDYHEEPFFENNTTKKFSLEFLSNRGNQMWANIKVITPDCIEVVNGNEMGCYLYQFYHATSEVEFEIEIGEYANSRINIIIEISVEGRGQKSFIPITLIRNSGNCALKQDY